MRIDDCLLPSEHPGLMAVKPSSNAQYVPDIFFQHKDKYNNEIKEAARPAFPVEYLIVDLPSGSRADDKAGVISLHHVVDMMGAVTTFNAKCRPFVVEHRQHMGEEQSINAVSDHISQTTPFLSKARGMASITVTKCIRWRISTSCCTWRATSSSP